MIKVAITHDVDRTVKTYQYFTHSLRHFKKSEHQAIARQLQSIFIRNTFWNFEDILDTENFYGVKSTFFFLNESIRFNLLKPSNWQLSLGRYNISQKKIINTIKKIDNLGFEVGVQGSYNSYSNQELLNTEKSILENIVGHEIIGIRQHYLNLTDNTWQLQKNAGFKYDSSLGFTDDIGYKDTRYNYFRPFDDDFVVIPLVIMDGPFMSLNDDKWEKFNTIVKETKEHNALLVLDWHTNNFNELEFPGYRSTFIEILQRLKNDGAKFYTLKEYYNETCSTFSA